MSDLKARLEIYRAALAADRRMSSSSIAALMTETLECIAELEAERNFAIDHRNTARYECMRLKREHGEMNVELIAEKAECERLRAENDAWQNQDLLEQSNRQADEIERLQAKVRQIHWEAGREDIDPLPNIIRLCNAALQERE